ncbi:HRDC domain-containing protein [Georgenia satyanarayanai]|uniref:HRDC domain-containing protein n=1 Tax=Georgenia satyanarayanai TaxID=860221 RepID=UPI00126484CD|nr:ribonuclease D [Georgenia satyanarayanai]
MTEPVDAETPPLVPVTEPREGTPPVITTRDGLARAAAALASGTGPVAADAERASGYRYGQRTYLVQLRREGVGTLLVDPIAVGDLSEVGEALAGTEWVLHAANQDLPGFHDLGMYPASLFDTELAARLLGRSKVGLGAIIAEELGYSLAKEHSAADWSTRPLPDDWLRYAALDVEFLVELRDRLAAALEEAGKLEWARQEFEAVRLAPDPAPRVDPWRRTSGMHAVRGSQGIAVVRELWQARDELARKRDRSPGRVLPDRAIVAAALAVPRSEQALAALPEFSGKGTRRSSGYWWSAVERALALPASEHPPRRLASATGTPPPPRSWADKDPAAAARLDAVRSAIRTLAEAHDVPQENLLSPAVQRQLAWTPPDVVDETTVREALADQGARPWQVDLTAAALTEALRAG